MRFLSPMALVLALAVPTAAFGSYASSRDYSFNIGGLATVATPVPGARAFGSDVLVQPDARIMVSAYMTAGNATTAFVGRLLADGQPDTSFGSSGSTVLSDVPAMAEGAVRVKLFALPGGRVLVLGAALARLSAEGVRDTAFGGGTGLARLPAGFVPGGLAVMPDGGIVVVGARKTGDTVVGVVVRLTEDGLLVAGFGTGGETTLALDGNPGGQPKASRGLLGAAALPDGGVVVAGEAATGSMPWETVFARLTASGAPDTTFGAAGRRVLAIQGLSPASLQRSSDGGLVLGARPAGADNGGASLAPIRLFADGTPMANYPTGWSDDPFSVSLAAVPGGGWLVSGASGAEVGFARFDVAPPKDGQAEADRLWDDDTLHHQAIATLPGSSDVRGRAALQADGKILMAGTLTDGNGLPYVMVVRLFGLSDPPGDVSLPGTAVATTRLAASLAVRCTSTTDCEGAAQLRAGDRVLAQGPVAIEALRQARVALVWTQAPTNIPGQATLTVQLDGAAHRTFAVTIRPRTSFAPRRGRRYGTPVPFAGGVRGFISDRRYLAFTQPGSVQVLDTLTLHRYAAALPQQCGTEATPADMSFPVVTVFCATTLIVNVQTSVVGYEGGIVPAIGRYWIGPGSPLCGPGETCREQYHNWRQGGYKMVSFPADGEPLVRDLDSPTLKPLAACPPYWNPTLTATAWGTFDRPLILVGNRADWDSGTATPLALGRCRNPHALALSGTARYPQLGGGLVTWAQGDTRDVVALDIATGARQRWRAPGAIASLRSPARSAPTRHAVILASGTRQDCQLGCTTDAWTLSLVQRGR